ncbi:Hsp20 family protein [Microdochium nivale]|nr:Hsp20 family protein [Microdochium nivale]
MAALFSPRVFSPYAPPHHSQQPTASEPSFHGLFRLLEDWDNHHNNNNSNANNTDNTAAAQSSTAVAGGKQQQHGQVQQPQPHKQQQGLTRRQLQQQPEPSVFTPRFDVRETDAAYELFGDLPGVAKGDISIEFSDPQTLVVRGHVERLRSSPVPAAASTTANGSPNGNDDGAEEHDDAVMIADHRSETSSQRSFQATVEEDKEEDQDNKERGGATAANPAAGADDQSKTVATTNTTPTTAAEKQQQPQRHQPTAHRYWIAERPTGSFARTFAFPERLDIDRVTASLRDGVLALVAPKAKRYEARRITLL